MRSPDESEGAMISDEERREVARKLREIERQTLCELTDGELIDFLVEAVGFNRYTNEDFDEGLLGRMADLIDRPTCEVVSVMFRDDYDEYEVELSCGDSIRWLGTAEDLAFCPSCGAEAVDAERRD